MKSFYKTGINELLVCIYEISGDLVFKYGICGCLALVTIVNPTHPNFLYMCCIWDQANTCFEKYILQNSNMNVMQTVHYTKIIMKCPKIYLVCGHRILGMQI